MAATTLASRPTTCRGGGFLFCSAVEDDLGRNGRIGPETRASRLAIFVAASI